MIDHFTAPFCVPEHIGSTWDVQLCGTLAMTFMLWVINSGGYMSITIEPAGNKYGNQVAGSY